MKIFGYFNYEYKLEFFSDIKCESYLLVTKGLKFCFPIQIASPVQVNNFLVLTLKVNFTDEKQLVGNIIYTGIWPSIK